jgi:hypothetical protein
VRHFVRELSLVVAHGRKRVFHALPRLLTAIIELGADCLKLDDGAGKKGAGPAGAMLDRLQRALTTHYPTVRFSCAWLQSSVYKQLVNTLAAWRHVVCSSPLCSRAVAGHS